MITHSWDQQAHEKYFVFFVMSDFCISTPSQAVEQSMMGIYFLAAGFRALKPGTGFNTNRHEQQAVIHISGSSSCQHCTSVLSFHLHVNDDDKRHKDRRTRRTGGERGCSV